MNQTRDDDGGNGNGGAGEPALRSITVEGRGGLIDGVKMSLRVGATLTVGRSRECDLSFRKAPGFKRREDRETLLTSREFNRLSRVHCELTLLGDGRVEVVDVSQNGTWVEGDRVKGATLVDLRHGAVHVDPLLGSFGSLVVRPE
ncbi:MAG: FHA domain-containing protein [Planctomycetes bacterium]|nr:FHA domain-containing protein [Planctomycetota bacterium]